MINRLPFWFRQRIPDNNTLETLHSLSALKINTVCQQARCPNVSHCFKNGEITFMILGDTCTRNCRFCAVNKSQGLKLGIDQDEPDKIAALIKARGFNYVVITSVTRDDLSDAGAGQFVRALTAIRARNKNIKVEVLIPDFKAKFSSLAMIVKAGPNVVSHNIETVRRLYPYLKPESDYEISLSVLRGIKKIKPGQLTKSSLMLGLGEKRNEVIDAMEELREVACDILTLGQYLAPSLRHYPVRDFISPETFREFKDIAMALGFKAVLSGPLVRSSYQAEQLYREACYV